MKYHVGTKIISSRTQVEAVITQTDFEGNVVIQTSTGEINSLTASTLKRWWKVVEPSKEPIEEIKEDKEMVSEPQETNIEETTVSPSEEAQAAPKRKGRPTLHGDHPLQLFLIDLAMSKGCTVFAGKNPGFRSIKVNDKMCLNFTFNTTGVRLWMRSEAVDELNLEALPDSYGYRVIRHMFDARMTMTEDTQENRNLLTQILDLSIACQQALNEKKAQKDQAKLERAARSAARKAKKDAEEGAGE